MKLKLEQIHPDTDSSFRLLLTPQLNEVFYWHFHPEIELVYVEAEQGIRHIGDHVSTYHGADLALIGSNIPHLNFDYGAKTRVETVVIQFPPDYFRTSLGLVPEMQSVQQLMERAQSGLAFENSGSFAFRTVCGVIADLPNFGREYGCHFIKRPTDCQPGCFETTGTHGTDSSIRREIFSG
jgi:hypothetical protein